MLTKRLLQKPDDLTALVFLPQDFSEIYYVVVPPESPDLRYLTPQGRTDYELSEGYEREVNEPFIKITSPSPNAVSITRLTRRALAGIGWLMTC